jgi:arginyl-tRNA synthetase
MMLEKILSKHAAEAVAMLYGAQPDEKHLQLQETRREFEGNYTLVVFPLTKISGQSPEATATAIGDWLQANCKEVVRYNVIKGFLNLVIADAFWLQFLCDTVIDDRYGYVVPAEGATRKMIEYSSPNTNKPLHLGHIRNNLLGWSLSKILTAAGHRIVKANLVNDRGIHICKSMLAWRRWGNNETPESARVKGDHLVGDYYVKFDAEYKREIKQLTGEGMSSEEAERKAPLILEAQEMLRQWEAGDPETVKLWTTMNGWVYDGFDVTYRRLGVSFDHIYYESQTYLLGKGIVMEGLRRGVFYQKDDGSVWVSLTDEGLDEKLLLRSDGTSVYMKQDIGTAGHRF